jgi:hypothetical protein
MKQALTDKEIEMLTNHLCPQVEAGQGTKKSAVELSRYLLNKGDRIPLIKAQYGKQGRVREGVEKLLRRANQKSDKNLYIIAIDKDVFKELHVETWKKREPKLGHADFLARIDDDPKLLNMVRRTLIYEGFQVVTATDGREALAQVQRQRHSPARLCHSRR